MSTGSSAARVSEPLAGEETPPSVVVELYPGAASAAPAPDPEDRTRHRLVRGERGMATAEYAIATLGAVAFAGLLVVILRSDEVRGFLLGIIRSALSVP